MDSEFILTAVNVTLTIANLALTFSKKHQTGDNSKTKKILIESTPDYINAKAYGNSMKKLMSSDDKKVTLLMILKYLLMTSKEALQMERDLMEKIKGSLISKGEEDVG